MEAWQYKRWGWFDRVGPYWFLRNRWACGPPWSRCWARFYIGPTGVALQAHTRIGGFAYAGTFIPLALWDDLSYAQKESLVMAWIREVRRPDEGHGANSHACDAGWLSEYPALHEYLVVSTNPDGSPRRTSTLTLFAEHGSFKGFLNERQSGASLCATGDSVAATLSALEVMLEAENTPWRFSDRAKEGNRQRLKKGP